MLYKTKRIPFRASVPTKQHKNAGGSVQLIFPNYHL